MSDDDSDTIQELRELAEEWREKYDHPSASSRENSKALAKEECARELLEVIENE